VLGVVAWVAVAGPVDARVRLDYYDLGFFSEDDTHYNCGVGCAARRRCR